MRELRIGDSLIDDEADCYVIAEIGNNGQGSVALTKQLFRAAKDCGCSAVKLQKRSLPDLYARAYYDRPYDHEHSFGRTYGEHREALEFSTEQYVELKAHAADLGIDFFATAFDERSADFLAELGVPAIKVASGDITNTPLLRHCASLGLPLIISTGTAEMGDVERAVACLSGADFALLQCTAAYPCEASELNLRVISTYRERWPDVVVGLSTHYNGIAMGPPAYVLGARILEQHFTLNRSMKGADHAFSLEPAGMRKLVRDLQRARLALGDGVKRRLYSEYPAIEKMGKSLYAARRLKRGQIIATGDFSVKSPGAGVQPYVPILGRRLLCDLEQDEPLVITAVDFPECRV